MDATWIECRRHRLYHPPEVKCKMCKKDEQTALDLAALAALERANAGYPDDNPKTQFGLAKVPMHLVPPVAIAHLARAFENGAGKYGPFNWREKTISSTVYYGAAMRHLMAWYDGEDLAPDSGVHHLAHAMACLAMVLDGQSIGKLNDNRPPKGGLPEMLEGRK